MKLRENSINHYKQNFTRYLNGTKQSLLFAYEAKLLFFSTLRIWWLKGKMFQKNLWSLIGCSLPFWPNQRLPNHSSASVHPSTGAVGHLKLFETKKHIVNQVRVVCNGLFWSWILVAVTYLYFYSFAWCSQSFSVTIQFWMMCFDDSSLASTRWRFWSCFLHSVYLNWMLSL